MNVLILGHTMRLHAAFVRLGFREGKEKLCFPLWQQAHWAYRLQIKKTDLNPITFELSNVPTWRCFLVQYHNGTCHAAVGFSPPIQQLHTCECPQCPRAWAGDRVALLGFFCFVLFSWNLFWFSLPVVMCHSLILQRWLCELQDSGVNVIFSHALLH